MNVRAVTAPDLPHVLNFWGGVSEVELNESDTAERLTLYLRQNPEPSPVAVANGKIVGAALCSHDGRRGYLNHLVVATSYRKQGSGKTMGVLAEEP